MNPEKIPPQIKRFHKWLDKFAKDEPNWFQLATLWIFKGALQSLRAFIEDPNEAEINWANPWAELQWEAEWDWESMQVRSYTLTEESLRDQEALASLLAEATVKHVAAYTLQLLTRKAALLKQGGEFSYLLPQDIATILKGMSEKDREAYLEKLYEPLSFGGILEATGLPENAPVPDEAAARLRKKLADLPSIFFKGETDGVPFEGTLVFQFNPLVVDEDTRRAYYPVICGIGFTPVDENTPPADPATWSPQDQKGFWNQTLSGLDKTIEGLTTWRPEAEAEPAVSDIAGIDSYGQYIPVLSAKRIIETRDAMSKKLFQERPDTPWPTFPFSEGGFIQLRPPDLETQLLLPPEKLDLLAEKMFTQIRKLSDRTADAFDIMTSTWIDQAKNVDSRARGDIDKFLAMRGLVTKHKDRGRAFRKKQRQEMLEDISLISFLWFDLGEVEIYYKDGNKTKKKKEAIRSRAFAITDTTGQPRFDGFVEDVHKFIYVPGLAFAHYLIGPGRQVMQLSSLALKYDPDSQKPEKRLTRYLSSLWRIEAKNSRFVKNYKVETLLEAVGEDAISPNRIKNHPGDARRRLEKALDRLHKDQVIAGWQYERLDEDITDKRGWFDAYRKTTIIIEAPAEIQEHYRSIFENTRKRIAKLPAPKAAPAPAPHFNGLGEKLRTERRRRKLTQLQMGEILGVSPGRVSQIETGRDNPSAKVQDKIRAWLSEKS